MKTSRVISVGFCCILCILFQQRADAVDMEHLTPDEARKNINSLDGERELIGFSIDAIRSRRMDLIQTCFENQYTMSSILVEVSKMPASSFKDQIVIMMLKSNSPFWRPEGWKNWGSQPPPGFAPEPFASVVNRYLPAIIFNEVLVSTRLGRLKLSEELENAIKGDGAGRKGNKTVPGPKLTAEVRGDEKFHPKLTPSVSTNLKSIEHPVELPRNFVSWYWFGIPLSFGIGAWLWLLVKHRR